MDDGVWDATVYSKNRDRMLKSDIARLFFQAVVEEARVMGLLSDEHFSVDRTLIEAWASQKSFSRGKTAANPETLAIATVAASISMASRGRTHESKPDPMRDCTRRARAKRRSSVMPVTS